MHSTHEQIPRDILRREFSSHVRDSFEGWVDGSQPHFQAQLDFAMGRLEEGIALVRYFNDAHPATAHQSTRLHTIDIGAGNGGTSLGMANHPRFSVTALDTVVNRDLLALRQRLKLPIRQLVGDGTKLPLDTASFDIVLLLETIEHVSQPQLLGVEIMRVLKPGGVCMITTPPRLHYLFRPDPHFGVRGLLLFPDPLQRWYVTRVAHRRFVMDAGGEMPYYDVHHIYWSVPEIARLFPDPKEVGVYYLPKYDVPKRFRQALRPYSWDRILIYKA